MTKMKFSGNFQIVNDFFRFIRYNTRKKNPEEAMLQKLNEKIDRFCALHPRFGVPGLMRYIVAGNVLVYLLTMFSQESALQFLWLDVERLLHGEVWRIFTFAFVPSYGSALLMAVALYFYYSIGTTLENQWGTGRFTVYYVGGLLLTVVATVLSYVLLGDTAPVSGADYVNLSLFFAYAMLYPDMQVLVFFVIPVKIKWLAYADAAWFAIAVLLNFIGGNWIGGLLPIVALLNFFIFFSPQFAYMKERQAYRSSPTARQYRANVRRAQQQEKKTAQQGWHHRCSVCGKTDTDYPELQFRYCSRCAGYHCYCSEHIFTHVHFTEETNS